MSEEIRKAAEARAGNLEADDLRKINTYALRELSEEEVFVFKAAVADNDVDRDHEYFPRRSLEGLSKLFVGKPVICNHEHRAENQAARIYRTEVIEGDRDATGGEQYAQLVARCYTVRAGNEAFIASVEGGIRKEVSVGCSMEKRVCSICGKTRGEGCVHRPGQTYDGITCAFALTGPQDAYELSFVPVPAQRAAGTVKAFEPLEMEPDVRDLIDRVNRTIKRFEMEEQL